MFPGREGVKLFVRQFSHQTLYTLAQGSLEAPIRLGGSLPSHRETAGLRLIGINVVLFLIIFGMSAIINRFKVRQWPAGDTDYEFASLFRRFFAWFLDNLLLAFVPACAIAIAMVSLHAHPSPKPLGLLLAIFGAVLFVFVGGFFYHSLCEGLLGWTVGKRICGIRVCKADLTPCTLGGGFLRNLMRIVDAFFYYLTAVVCLSATVKWQRLGDLVGETVVVRRKKVSLR